MLRLGETHYRQIVGHVYDGLPLEACGLLVGRADGPGRVKVEAFVPCRNAAASAKRYTIGPDGWAAADRETDAGRGEVLGVVHSHTHTDAYPSPTDVEEAANPLLAGWHFAIVSLKDGPPVLRSFLIEDGVVTEEPVVVERR